MVSVLVAVLPIVLYLATDDAPAVVEQRFHCPSFQLDAQGGVDIGFEKVSGVGQTRFTFGWSYFGEKCWEYLVGTKAILPFRLVWVVAVPFGAIAQLDFAWLLADTLNGLMAIPNLLSLLLLSPVVVALTREYFAKQANVSPVSAK